LAETTPSKYVLELPKAELHLHLEGSVRPETLVELSRRHDAAPLNVAAVEKLYRYADFSGFLMAFKSVTDRLQTPEDYELITFKLLEQLAQDNVAHAEITFSAGVCLWRKQDVDAIFAGMERGRERGEREFGVSALWIWDAIRQFGAEPAMKVVEAAARNRATGFGIGGDERKGPPEMFRDVYTEAKRRGLRLTAHAGETAGPESIWGALNLGAERIGHGMNAMVDAELMHVLAERQVPVEVCVTSNLRTGCCRSLREHPVRKMFDEGLMVTISSDDPAMFGTTVAGEYALLQSEFGFTDDELRELARNSFEASFLPAEKKVALLDRLDKN
jgi:adenosine deaminase/aminodeoxyfutalosine deaminase